MDNISTLSMTVHRSVIEPLLDPQLKMTIHPKYPINPAKGMRNSGNCFRFWTYINSYKHCPTSSLPWAEWWTIWKWADSKQECSCHWLVITNATKICQWQRQMYQCPQCNHPKTITSHPPVCIIPILHTQIPSPNSWNQTSSDKPTGMILFMGIDCWCSCPIGF